MNTPRAPLLIFDGDCGFCTSSAEWVSRGWGGDTAQAIPWQTLGEGGLTALGLTATQAQDAAWWVDSNGRLFRGHHAIGKSLAACRGWKRAAGLTSLTPPFAWIAAGLYPLVVRYRYRLPGGTPACRSDALEGRTTNTG